jgi:hypothetical protein
MKKQFKMNAIKDPKCYKHFGIHPSTASLYGHKEEEIVEVLMGIAEDQTRPEPNNHPEEADYWGWIATGEEEPTTLLYAQYFLLNMCFPYGIKASEEKGQGKAYRLKIIEESDNKN